MLLEVRELRIDLPTAEGWARVVEDVAFSLDAGGSLGVAGESGSGKTMLSLALMGLLPEGARVSGSIRFEGRELLGLADRDWRRLRGDAIAMIFQEPMTALNPVQRVGDQIAEPLRWHRGLDRAAARRRALDLIARVRLRDPERIARAYPHHLSGGERQRAMIAMALSCEPRLLIADEPTTALDVTVQAGILDLIAALAAESGMAVLLVSHDLAVIARHCAQAMILYGGVVMEAGPVQSALGDARHPYTSALLAARPRLGALRGSRLLAIAGSAPAAGAPRPGCRFAPRCPRALVECSAREPTQIVLPGGHVARCLRLDAEGRLP